jgi:hypothetical protein
MELNAKIDEVRVRLLKSERREGQLVVGRLYDDLIFDLEWLFEQNTIRRPLLSERLGLTLLQLTQLEEDIFHHQKRKAEFEKNQEDGFQPEIEENIQFQAVTVRKNEQMPVPQPAVFQDSKTWIRIVSMTGLKVELNSLESALEILKIVIQAHRRPER